MIKTRLNSLRLRLMLLALLTVAPALALTLYTASEQRRQAATDVQEDAQRLTRLASAGQQRLIEGASRC